MNEFGNAISKNKEICEISDLPPLSGRSMEPPLKTLLTTVVYYRILPIFILRHFTNFCVTSTPATANDENSRITENLVCCRCCFCNWLHFFMQFASFHLNFSRKFVNLCALISSFIWIWSRAKNIWNHMPHSQIVRHPRFNYTHIAKQCPRAKRFHLIKNCVVICNKFSFRLMLIEYTSFHWAKQTKLRIYIIAALDTSIQCKIY